MSDKHDIIYLETAKEEARRKWQELDAPARAAWKEYEAADRALKEAVMYAKAKRRVMRDLIDAAGDTEAK